jgi:hypothetical protein
MPHKRRPKVDPVVEERLSFSGVSDELGSQMLNRLSRFHFKTSIKSGEITQKMLIRAIHEEQEISFDTFQSPDPAIRQALFRKSNALVATRLGLTSDADASSELRLETAFAHALRSDAPSLNRPRILEKAISDGTILTGPPEATISRLEASALTLPYLSIDGAGALKHLLDAMVPRTYDLSPGKEGDKYVLAHARLIDDYFSDPKIARTVLVAVQKTLQRIRAFETGASPEPSDLQADLREATREALGRVDDETVWKILGFYAVRGPVVPFWKLMRDDSQRTFHAATEVLFTGLTYLDSLQMKAGSRSYALPRGVKSRDPIPKAYHFWMSAYLVRDLAVNQGYSEKGASVAAHIAHLGYEYAAQTPGRTPLYGLSHSPVSWYNNIIRQDMLIAAAGNAFGRDASRGDKHELSRPLDLDRLWEDYESQVHAVPGLDSQVAQQWINGSSALKARGYLRWKRLMRADYPYESIRRELDH